MEKKKKRSTAAAATASLLPAGAVVVVLYAVTSSAAGEMSRRHHLVPAIYVFGDSLVDVGNNDFLPAPPAPRTEPPCGVDLPRGVAGGGRFTNGYNLADIIAQRVGFEMSPPAYLSLRQGRRLDDLRRGRVGANYASGGSGILDTTGNGTVTLRKQVQFFADTKASMSSMAGNTLNPLLSQSLFITCTGNNDFAGMAATSEPPAAYIAGMVATYIEHIKALYKLGARRLGILDALPIGCVPASRVPVGDGACDDGVNALARRFNRLLRAEMAGAAADAMPELMYSVGSVYNIFSDMIADPLLAGMEEAASACCGGGKLNAEAACSASSNLCGDRGDYVFWDKVHGTQAAYRRCAVAFFNGSTRYAEPVDFEQLIPLAVDDLDRSRTNRTAEI